MEQRRARTIRGLAVVAAAALLIGCGRSSSGTTAATKPAAASHVADTESTLLIAGKPYRFPPARITVESAGSGVLAEVYSEGASPEGERDGYYLEFPLDVPDPAQVDGASWQYESKSNERSEEMLSAVTVNGGGNQLQPRAVTVTFRDASPGVVEVRISGEFNVFRGKDGITSTGVVAVDATLQATRRGP